jgi:hypothetical protein
VLVDCLLQLAVGRLVLAWLPPGWPGYGDREELGATLSASWLIGALAVALLPLWWVWALVLGVRLATLPGSLRPRHGRPLRAGVVHAAVFVLSLSLFFTGHSAASTLLTAGAWLVTAPLVWYSTADRRARALGVVALASALLEAVS